MGEAIKVKGLKEFNRGLKKLDSDLPKLVRLALNKAADVVIKEAQPHVPKKTGRAAKTITAKSTRTEVRVSAGGRRAPYYPWLDFGGKRSRGVGRPKEKTNRRSFSTDGRYLYPAYYRLRDSGEFVDIMSEALVDVARKAGIEVE